MRIQLNDEAINQLGFIMARAGYSNQQHCLQVMISSVANNLRRAECKKKTRGFNAMSNIDYFMAGLSRAVVRVNERRDKKAQHAQKIESKGEFSGDAAFSKTKIKPSAFKLTDDQYKTIITSKMISHIKKKGAMNDYSYHGRPSPI